MLEKIETIFDNKEQMMKHLKKSGYAENMKQFRASYGHYFDEMVGYVESAEDKAVAASVLADDFTSKIKQAHLNRLGFVSGKNRAELNLFMVYYVFPAIQLTENPAATDVCDALVTSWGKTFPKDKIIGYTTYEELLTKFRDKIFGIF